MSKHLDIKFKEHIISLYHRNYKIFDIADIYQITERTVYNIINRYESNILERKKGTGNKFNNKTWNKIKNIVDKHNNLNLTQISNILDEKYNIKCSRSSVHRYLINYNYVFKKSLVKPLLTDDHKNDRENWAIFYQNYNWDKVIWSDETAISIQPNNFSKIWIHKDDNDIKRVIKYPLKIHIWGCILKDYKLIIYIYDKTMNSDKYIQILKIKLLPLIYNYKKKSNDKLIFQQDNASCHH